MNKKIKYSQETKIFNVVWPTSCLYPQAMPTKNQLSMIWITKTLINTHKPHQHELTNPRTQNTQ